MSDFQPGEIVNITIKGAQVDEVGRNGLHVVMPNGTTAHIELSNYEGVTVERVAPAEWPPRPGDLWRDCESDVWFAVEDAAGEITMVCQVGMCTSRPPDELMRTLSPLALVHREDEQDGKSKTPTAGTEVPNRPGRVVGDCGHPVWRAVWDGGERTCQPCQDAFAAEMSGGDQPLLLDPDCRDGKHGSCVGGLCECVCHEQDGGRSDG